METAIVSKDRYLTKEPAGNQWEPVAGTEHGTLLPRNSRKFMGTDRFLQGVFDLGCLYQFIMWQKIWNYYSSNKLKNQRIDYPVMTGYPSDWVRVMTGYQSDWVPVMTGYPVGFVLSPTVLVHLYHHVASAKDPNYHIFQRIYDWNYFLMYFTLVMFFDRKKEIYVWRDFFLFPISFLLHTTVS